MSRQTDWSEPPVDPQLQLGATTSEAERYAEVTNEVARIGPPGNIVDRLGQQFSLPRADAERIIPNYEDEDAEPSAHGSRRPGINVGES